MWGDPRPSNRMDPFRRNQEERFTSGWNRDFLAYSDGLALERNAGIFHSGRDLPRPFEFPGMLGSTGRQFAGREEVPSNFASRGGPLIDFRSGDRMALDFQARNLQPRELSLLDFRAREALAAGYRGRDAHPVDFRSREGLMMDYRERDGTAGDLRSRELPPLEFKDRDVPRVDYRERESLADFRSREASSEFRGRGMLDMDFRSKELPHPDMRGMNPSDNDFRNRNQPFPDFRAKDGSLLEFLGNSSSALDLRDKDVSQMEARSRDVSHSEYRASGTSDLDFRGRDAPMFNFQGSERPRTDQDFRERDTVGAPVDFMERGRPPPNQTVMNYMQSQTSVREQEVREGNVDKTGDPAVVRLQYNQEKQTDNQEGDGQSHGPSQSAFKNSDGQIATSPVQEESPESERPPPSTGEQQRAQPGRGVKRGVDLDFLGRQDTDYRNMDYQDVDLRFDYSHGKPLAEERAAKDPRHDLQMSKSGRGTAKSTKISQASAPYTRSAKEEHAARSSGEDFDGFVQRISSTVSAALDPKNTKVTDVDQDYRPASSGEECASRFIQIQGLPATADKEEILDSFRTPDGNPIEDLQLSDYNPGGVISVRSPPKEVWICGHSLVQCAKERARRLPQGTQLGISCHKAKITWMGEVGMKWDQLIPTMQEMVGKSPAPDLIVVHLGENDLMQMTGVDLIIRIKKDLRYLMTLFPRAHIMWSSLLPRRVWLGAKKPAAIDRTRKEINREVKLFCRQAGMLQLQHDAIRFEIQHQFSKDGEQLSELGLEIFTADLQGSIQGWLNVR